MRARYVALWGDSLTAGVHPLVILAAGDRDIFNGGVGGDTSTQIKTRFDLERAQYARDTVVWAGRNNYADPTTVKSDIAGMVATLTTPNYLVLSVLNGDFAGEQAGGAGYTTITTLNTDLAATYGRRYFDMRAHLIAQHNNSAQDLADAANDIVPSSLRIDQIHLTTAGYAIVAAKIAALLFV